MMNLKQFLALIGFLFVAAWVGFGLGYALRCLIGAALFYGIGAVLEGEIDLGEVQTRVQGGRGGGARVR
jgi:hypothetical protein